MELIFCCANDDINTTNVSGKMISRILTSVSQNEIERTSEKTKFGLAGAIKEGHISVHTPFDYKSDGKLLVPDLATKHLNSEMDEAAEEFYHTNKDKEKDDGLSL